MVLDQLLAARQYVVELPTAVRLQALALASAVLLVLWAATGLPGFVRRAYMLRDVPTGCRGNWLLGHLLPLMDTGAATWDTLNVWLDSTGTGIMKWRILNTYFVAVKHPADLKRIMQTRMASFSKELSFTFSPFMPILGTGLVTANGRHWQDMRTHMGTALRVDILDDIVGISHRAVNRLTAKLEAHRGSGSPVDMEEEFRLITLQVICEAILSLPPEESDKVFPTLYLPVMTEANKRVLQRWRAFLPTPEWWRFQARMYKLNTYITGLLRKRWAARSSGWRPKPGHGDMLDRMMEGVEASGKGWSTAEETHLCYQVKTFLLAGHETSAAMLTFTLYELTRDDALMRRVRSEADTAFGAGEGAPTREAADGMLFTLACLKETLRKYSVVPVVTRQVDRDEELAGHVIPRGTLVACHLQAAHRLWKDGETYDPARFMPDGEYDQFDDTIRPFMFVPFTQGPRNCLGQHLALLEARIVMSLLVKRFKFTRANGGELERHETTIPVGPKDGLRMYIA